MRDINKFSRADLISCYDFFIQTNAKYLFSRFAGVGRPKYFARETDWSKFAIEECRNQIINADTSANTDMLENLSIFFCDASSIYQHKMKFSKIINQFDDPYYICHEIIESFIDFLINAFGLDMEGDC